MTRRLAVAAAAIATTLISIASPALISQPRDAIVYTVRVPAPETHYAEVQASVPTGGRTAIELMMPIWSPGYYRIEDYAGKVEDVKARTRNGAPLSVEKPQKNRWRIQTGGEPSIAVSYRVFCNQRSVTTNYVDSSYGVLNGAPTFMTVVESSVLTISISSCRRRGGRCPAWTPRRIGRRITFARTITRRWSTRRFLPAISASGSSPSPASGTTW